MTWMAENLRTTTYNDGRPIQLMEADTLWDNTALAGYCIYNNNQSYLPYYGILYNWYSVNKGTLCPDGWHVPSVEEWGRLLEYLGNDPELAGGKLKENGTTHWESPNFGASDMFGFKALPGGSRDPLGNFSSLKISAYFWSSSVQVDLLAYSVGLLSNSSFLYSNSHHKGYGFSVRCLKN